MKRIVLVIAALSLAQVAMAKRGGSNPGRLAFKNSQAGFVSESVENSLEMFVRANASMKNMVQDASVVSQTPDDSVVTISLSDGSAVSYTYLRFDDWSRGGTVLKKEVVCRLQ